MPLRISTFVMLALTALAQDARPDPDPARFADAIAAFERWDTKNATPSDPVLFVGSSSIVGWKSAEGFPGLPVINRGFGGSHMSDLLHYYERVVKPYNPRVIVLYEGDNDVEWGKSPERVVADYRKFFDRVGADFPRTPIIVVAIKPSIARWEKWPAMKRTNELLAEICAADERLLFADIAPPMLGGDGRPTEEMFVSDGLHLSDEGYRRWQEVVRPMIEAALR